MKYEGLMNGCKGVMVSPDSVEEAGLFHWLAMRFKGKPVTLVFDTTDRRGVSHAPTLWITAAPEPTDSKGTP